MSTNPTSNKHTTNTCNHKLKKREETKKETNTSMSMYLQQFELSFLNGEAILRHLGSNENPIVRN